MRKLIKLNVLVFIIYILMQLLDGLEFFLIFRFLHCLIGLVAIMVLSGINFTVIMQLFYKKNLDIWEFLSISSVTGLILPPMLISIEFTEFNLLFKELPIINSFVIFLIMIAVYYFKNKVEYKVDFKTDKFKKTVTDLCFPSVFFWVLVLYISIIIFIFSAYYALPDLDPFYWIQRYNEGLINNSITKLTLDRPFFISLIYVLNQGIKIDVYAVFKYILPFLSILVLIPSWLVARKQSSKIIQSTILMLPLASPSTILYLQTPMPQAIVIILTYYFFFFLIYSWLFKIPAFYYFAGIIIFFGSFYHETAMSIFIVWFFVTLIFDRKKIVEYIFKNKLITLLIISFIFSNIFFVKNQIKFISDWFVNIFKYSFLMEANFCFPAYYINMNGQSMGWEGFAGVAKYYLYYTGPFLLFLVAFSVYISIKSSDLIRKLGALKINKELTVLAFCFILFFSISEILPRALNFSLLPERTWIFAGIFLLTLFFIIINFFNDSYRSFYLLSIFLILISILGALYINNLKRNVITSAKIKSTEWIKENLPENKIFFTDLNRNLLNYYGKTETIKVPTVFFFDYKVSEEIINKHHHPIDTSSSTFIKDSYFDFIELTKKNVEKLSIKNPEKQKDSILEILEKNIKETVAITSLLNSERVNNIVEPRLYIYYSKPSKSNPYINRPYYEKNNIYEQTLIFDKYPDKFMRIYKDETNSISIWEII